MAAIRIDGVASSQLLRPGPRPRSHSQIGSRSALARIGFPRRHCFQLSWRLAFESFGNGRNVLGSVAAAATGNIDQSSACEVAQITSHVLGTEIEAGFRERIWQAGVGVA